MAYQTFTIFFSINDGQKREKLYVAAQDVERAKTNAIEIYEGFVRMGYIKNFKCIGSAIKKPDQPESEENETI